MVSRSYIEQKGRLFAYTGEHDGYLLSNIMGEFNLALDPTDKSLTPSLSTEGFWEAWITAWVWNTVEPGSLFIDVGANCGYYTMVAEKLGADVLAYEPNPNYVRLLKKTREVNNARFDIRDVALSDHEGEITLSVPGDLHGSGSIVHNFTDWDDKNTFTVDVTSLDNDYDSAQSDAPYILKIDAEGAEQQIWHGAQDLLNSHRPGVVLLEWTPEAYGEDFYDELTTWGNVMYITGDGMELDADWAWLASQEDWVVLVIRKYPWK